MRLTLFLMRAALIRWRYIESRVPYEESGGLQREAEHIHRHDRPVFWPHHMVGSKGVPHNEIGFHQRALLLHVGRQPIAAAPLVRVVSGSIALLWVVGGNPEVAARKTPSLPLRRSLVKERECIRPRHEFVCDGLAQGIENSRIDDFPVTR